MQRTVILLILTLVWAAVLIPHHLANRSIGRPVDPQGATRTRQLARRRHPAARGSEIRRRGRSAQAQRRRRRRLTFRCLLALSTTTLVLGFVPGLGSAHLLHLASDVVLAAYVSWLVHLRSLAASRAAIVRPLHPRRPPGAPGGSSHPVFWLERTGS